MKIRKRPFHYLVVFLCLVNLTLAMINAGIWIIAAYQKLFFSADFTSFYTSFYMVRIGEGGNIYDAALQSKYQQLFMGGLTFEGGVLRYANPPFIAILFSPLSFFSLDIAFYLWTLLQLVLLIWLLLLVQNLFKQWEKFERAILIITLLAFWPLINSFLLGQFSLFLLICLVQLYIYVKDSKPTKAGFWLALMTVKPQTLLIPGMMTLNRRNWRVAASAMLVGLILFVASSLFLGLQPWIQYVKSLQALGAYFNQYGVNPGTEYTVRGVLSNLLGNAQGDLTNMISLILLLSGMVFVWFLWRKAVSQDHPSFDLYFAISILFSVLLSMHLNPHDALMLVLPAALFYNYLRQCNYPLKAYTIFILFCPLVFFIAAFNPYNLFGVIRPPIVLMFILLGWMAYYLFRDFQLHEKRAGEVA